jgi:hypothetical protein
MISLDKTDQDSDGSEACNILMSFTHHDKRNDDKYKNRTTQYTKNKKKRFLWSEHLHSKFIAAIFDIGLQYANLEVICQMANQNRSDIGQVSVKTLTIDNHLSSLRQFHIHDDKEIVRLSTNRLEKCANAIDMTAVYSQETHECTKADGCSYPVPLELVYHYPIVDHVIIDNQYKQPQYNYYDDGIVHANRCVPDERLVDMDLSTVESKGIKRFHEVRYSNEGGALKQPRIEYSSHDHMQPI